MWYETFLQDLGDRQYTYTGTHNQIGVIGPNIREIHFLDITVPEQNLKHLLADLAPYTTGTSKQKRSAMIIKKSLWAASKVSSFYKGATLHPIPDVKPSKNLRKHALNIMPLFWFEDEVCYDLGLILPQKDGGGELL